MTEVWELPAAELGSMIARKETSARDVVDAHLSRIEALDDSVNAFLTLTPDLAAQRQTTSTAGSQRERSSGRSPGCRSR